MRKKFFILLLAVLFFLGCGQENELGTPQDARGSSSSAAAGQAPSPEHSSGAPSSLPQPFVQEIYPTVWDEPAAKDQAQAYYKIHASVETKAGPYEEILIERVAFDQKTVRDIFFCFTQTSDVSVPSKKVTSVIRVEESEYEIFWQDHSLTMSCGSKAILQPESWVLRGDAYPGEPAGTQLEHVNIQEEQAESLAKAFLSEIGVAGFTCVAAEKARLINGELPLKIFSEGWWLIYVKEYEHYVPLAYNRFTPNMPGLSIERANRIAPYRQEVLWMLINEEGCQLFDWYCPTRIVQQTDSGIPLLSFAEVKDVFQKLLTESSYPPISEGDLITVTKLTLCAGMTKDAADPNRAILIPIWAASYTTENMISDGHVPGLLCIDARTGEHINPLIY